LYLIFLQDHLIHRIAQHSFLGGSTKATEEYQEMVGAQRIILITINSSKECSVLSRGDGLGGLLSASLEPESDEDHGGGSGKLIL
jgi:hypothetical protein